MHLERDPAEAEENWPGSIEVLRRGVVPAVIAMILHAPLTLVGPLAIFASAIPVRLVPWAIKLPEWARTASLIAALFAAVLAHGLLCARQYAKGFVPPP